jgi:hypothetical protein
MCASIPNKCLYGIPSAKKVHASQWKDDARQAARIFADPGRRCTVIWFGLIEMGRADAMRSKKNCLLPYVGSENGQLVKLHHPIPA